MTTWVDFETRSPAKFGRTPLSVGTYMYAAHPHTNPICLSWVSDDEPEDVTHLWHPAFPVAGIPEEGDVDLLVLFDRIARGDTFEAHNAFFERCIWRMVMSLMYDWPDIDDSQWRCSAAVAASFALPRNLEGAVAALRLSVQKDMEGNRLMKKLSKPRKPYKRELKAAGLNAAEYHARFGYSWHEKPEELHRVFDYCRLDVRAERALSGQLRPLPLDELATWQLDQKMNMRGVWCDRAMVKKCLVLAKEEVTDLGDQLWALTGGDVEKTTKRVQLLSWSHSQGVPLDDTKADTLDEWIDSGQLPNHVERAYEIWRSANRTSVAKYGAMMRRIASDDRIRDLLRYHGASTGRWAGVGIQPQNFPRGFKSDMEAVCSDILVLTREQLQEKYGDVMVLISKAIRGAVGAAPGHDLLVADYSAIEARGTFWIAGHKEGLKIFREFDAGRGPDIYVWQSAEILKKPYDQITEDERNAPGKVVILGCGYQMGGPKLVSYAASMGIHLEEDEAKGHVASYRDTNWPVKQYWYDIESAAIEAVRRGNGGPPVTLGRIQFAVRGRFLHCKLPSGRFISYCDPWLEPSQTPWGEPCIKVRFWGVHSLSRKWVRDATYGGKLTENIVQALCRDLMRDAMLRAEARGYPCVLTSHDEVAAEVPEGYGSVKEFEAIMEEVPPWAEGFPINAKGWKGKRYRK